MSTPYLGEIKMVSFSFPPKGWAYCNGQTLPISQNQALFSLLGTMYGGDGQTTFRLPDLQGRMPLHQGSGYPVGQPGGEATHILTPAELPLHTHQARAAGAATNPGGTPTNSVWANSGNQLFSLASDSVMGTGALSTGGNSQPHENRPPYLTLNFIIALTGIFPPRS